MKVSVKLFGRRVTIKRDFKTKWLEVLIGSIFLSTIFVIMLPFYFVGARWSREKDDESCQK